MRNITVSVDEETHRLARIRAAELDTSVSALVREYLRDLSGARGALVGRASQVVETPRARSRRIRDELLDDIRATRGGFRASDNVSREELYERRALR